MFYKAALPDFDLKNKAKSDIDNDKHICQKLSNSIDACQS